MGHQSRTLDKVFCAALSLLLAACFRPGVSLCPEDYACRNADNAAPRYSQDAGTDDVIRTTAARPAINLGSIPVNLARTRLSLCTPSPVPEEHSDNYAGVRRDDVCFHMQWQHEEEFRNGTAGEPAVRR